VEGLIPNKTKDKKVLRRLDCLSYIWDSRQTPFAYLSAGSLKKDFFMYYKSTGTGAVVAGIKAASRYGSTGSGSAPLL
jgi:hypothetical protein